MSTHDQVRPARAEDRASIIEVAGSSGLFADAELTEVSATLDAFLDGSADRDQWLVDPDGPTPTVAAVAYYAPERMSNGTWNLLMLVVHPDRQGRGRGAAMVGDVEDRLRRTGARVLLIETAGTADFAGQGRFYAGLGYRQEARIHDYYDQGVDKIVFWKQLSSTSPG